MKKILFLSVLVLFAACQKPELEAFEDVVDTYTASVETFDIGTKTSMTSERVSFGRKVTGLQFLQVRLQQGSISFVKAAKGDIMVSLLRCRMVLLQTAELQFHQMCRSIRI